MSLNPISSQSLTVFIYLFNPSDPPGPVGVEEALSGGRSEFILPRSTLYCVEAPGPESAGGGEQPGARRPHHLRLSSSATSARRPAIVLVVGARVMRNQLVHAIPAPTGIGARAGIIQRNIVAGLSYLRPIMVLELAARATRGRHAGAWHVVQHRCWRPRGCKQGEIGQHWRRLEPGSGLARTNWH